MSDWKWIKENTGSTGGGKKLHQPDQRIPFVSMNSSPDQIRRGVRPLEFSTMERQLDGRRIQPMPHDKWIESAAESIFHK
jgi:hypothetical protein